MLEVRNNKQNQHKFLNLDRPLRTPAHIHGRSRSRTGAVVPLGHSAFSDEVRPRPHKAKRRGSCLNYRPATFLISSATDSSVRPVVSIVCSEKPGMAG